MTREERDALQEELDLYSKKKGKVKNPRQLSMVKMVLGMRLSKLIPDVEVAGADLTLLIGPIASFFLPKDPAPSKFSVVNGHGEAWVKLEEKFGKRSIPSEEEEKWWDEYGLVVPGDLAIEAMRIKSNNKLVDLMFKKRGA